MALDLGTAVGYLDLDTSQFQNGLQSAFSQLKTFTDKSATAGQQWSALGKTMATVGSGLTKGVTLPLVGVATAAVSVGNSFEAQMDRVQGTLQATDAEMESLRDQAIQLGADTAFSASEAAEGMENLASAGFTSQEIMEAMPGLLDLAASSGASLGDASAYAATTLNAFNLEASEAGHVADVYALAAAKTNAQTEDMGEAMKYIAPVASAMNQSLEETAAAIGIMSNAGIMGSQAGTTLRSALSSIARPSEAAAEKMEALGLSFYDAEGNMKSWGEMISMLQDSLSGLTMEEQNNALVTIFGQEALSGLQALIAAGPEQLDELTAALETSDGAAADMAATMQDNAAGAIEQMFGAFESAGIVIQEKLQPFIVKVANTIGDLATKFSQLDDTTLEMIVTIGGIVAALGPTLLIFGNVAKAIGTITTVATQLGGITGIISSFGTAISGVFTAITGPVGIAIAIVGALFIAWQTDFNGMRDTVSSCLSSIQSIITNVISIIQSIITIALGIITALWESNFANIQGIVTSVFNAIQDVIDSALKVINDIVAVFAALLKGDWEGLWNALTDLLADWVTLLLTIVGNALNMIIQLINGIWGGVVEAWNFVLNGAKDVFMAGWNAITDWFSQAVEDPVGAILGIGEALYNAGKYVFGKLFDSIKGVWDEISGFVSDSVNWLIDKVTFWDNESSRMSTSSVGSGRSVQGSYASGIDYIPRDMIVRVHEGERIMTKEENENSGEAKKLTIEVPLYINGKKFARATAKDIDTELGKLND